ncbi:hypothetical protein JK165_12980 [Acetobacter okinawensis]|uniref:hypothetical protein n=1 Tax=Acetobacter okinawensis TaxID=1076594 RepID=UPI001BA99D4A|nr:hypothetical protein [Acetobacter okinawensis]MBS0966988.1 hypothetical protein [Acetobacter okinawensis]
MKAIIVDQEALKAVSPTAMVAYVVAEGWHRTSSYGDHSDVYECNGKPELILPGTDDLADYPTIVSDILRFLSKQEDRDELQIYRDLVSADKDVVRLRSPYADSDGAISIDTGVELVIQGRDLLQSAACAAKEPRATYRAGKVKDASAYMERVKLGQTEQGSFIISLLAPVPPALDIGTQASFWPLPSEEPFDRKVTRTLVGALESSRRAAEATVRGRGSSAFHQAIQDGVSANLCDALSILISRNEGLEVSVTWARTRPTPESRRVISFSEAEGEIFHEAARILRAMEPRPDEHLEAFVVGLDRQLGSDDGRVTLKAYIDNQLMSVRTTLPPNLYEEAVHAHKACQMVTIHGDLIRSGHRWVLDHPRDMMIIPNDNSDD